jgi:hypothetical protein
MIELKQPISVSFSADGASLFVADQRLPRVMEAIRRSNDTGADVTSNWDVRKVKAAADFKALLSVCTDPSRPHPLYLSHESGHTVSALDMQTGALAVPVVSSAVLPVHVRTCACV